MYKNRLQLHHRRRRLWARLHEIVEVNERKKCVSLKRHTIVFLLFSGGTAKEIMNIFAVEIYFVILSTLNTKLTTNPTCAILNINEQKKLQNCHWNQCYWCICLYIMYDINRLQLHYTIGGADFEQGCMKWSRLTKERNV